MTYRCEPCDVNWWPYMTGTGKQKGSCPECGGGTRRVYDAGSLDAEARFKAASARRAEIEELEKRRAAFEEFCKQRDSEALKRTLTEIDGLPVAEPDRRQTA